MDDHRSDGPGLWVDEAVVRRIVDAAGTVDSPYGDVETLLSKVRSLYPFLVRVARERGCTDHGTVAEECGVHPARQGRVLHVLGVHEDQLDRPLLPAVVTRANGATPGDAYFRMVEGLPGRPDDVPADTARRRWIWSTHRAAVYRKWAGTGEGGATGRQFDAGRTTGSS